MNVRMVWCTIGLRGLIMRRLDGAMSMGMGRVLTLLRAPFPYATCRSTAGTFGTATVLLFYN